MRSLIRGYSPRVLLLTFAAAVVLFCQLMVPPVPGMADNGDFGKLLGRYGLGTGKGYEYADTKYFFNHRYRYRSDFYSSELLLLDPALRINRVISKDGFFDIRVIGAIHACLFLLA